jgi:glycosyltransferase involved in cell wall biosynthesis
MSMKSAPLALEKGLVVWPQVACRTTEGVIVALAKRLPSEVTVVLTDSGQARSEMKWDAPRFDNCSVVRVSPGDEHAVRALVRSRPGYVHIVGSWTQPSLLRTVGESCAKRGTAFGVWSEAPLSRYQYPGSVLAYGAYIRYRAYAARHVIKAARFFLNSSGSDCSMLVAIGWNPVVLYPFGYFPAARRVKARPIDDSKLRMVSLGHLRPQRATQDALLAMRLLADRGIEAELDVVGDGPMRATLEQLARRLRITNSVRFHGFVSDDVVEEVLGRTSIMLCTGRAEAWGVRINEGLAAGFVVVASDRIGACEVLARNGAGALHRPSDVTCMAMTLEALSRMPRIGRAMQLHARDISARLTPDCASVYAIDVIRHALGAEVNRPAPPWLYPERLDSVVGVTGVR